MCDFPRGVFFFFFFFFFFCHSPFSALVRQCFVIVAFPGNLHTFVPFYLLFSTPSHFCKRVHSKRNEFAPMGSNFFPLRVDSFSALRKHAYSNILKLLPPKKNEIFLIKTSVIFQISAQNIDCGYSLKPQRRGVSNEYPQSIFLSRNKKHNVYPC